jgi:hypothetical protein
VEPAWQRTLAAAADTLMTDVHLRHEALALDVACRESVDGYENVFLRAVRVKNLADTPCVITAFFSQACHVGEGEVGHTTAAWRTGRDVVNVWRLISSQGQRGPGPSSQENSLLGHCRRNPGACGISRVLLSI